MSLAHIESISKEIESLEMNLAVLKAKKAECLASYAKEQEKARLVAEEEARRAVAPAQVSYPIIAAFNPSGPTDDEKTKVGVFTPSSMTFMTYHGVQRKSPTGFCRAILTRKDPESQTNSWRGPHHAFLLINGEWTAYFKTEFYKP